MSFQKKKRVHNKSIQEVRNNIITNHELSRDDYEVLKAAYIYGTATPMIALINVLRDMSKSVNDGETIVCVGLRKGITAITKENINDVIEKLFDSDVLNLMLKKNNK